MHMITTRSRYGLRLLADIAEHGTLGLVDLGSVARRQGIPEKYLAKLAQPLKTAGMLRATRGVRGGYVLSRAPAGITLLDVVRALEGKSSVVPCADAPASCGRSSSCRARDIWTGLDGAMEAYLAGLTVEDAMGAGAPDYSI